MDDVATEPIATSSNELSRVTENATNAAEISNSAKLDPTSEVKTGKSESKNSSLEEDMLGANSLLMSDSDNYEDDDDVEKVPVEKNKLYMETDEKCDKQIDELNEETETIGKENITNLTDVECTKPEIQEEAMQGTFMPQKKKKFSAILDSDSDESESNVVSRQISDTKPKFSAVIDTDSDSDHKKEPNEAIEEPKKSQFKLIDSDSDSDDDVNKRSSKSGKNRKKLMKKRHSIKPGLIDSDSDSASERNAKDDDDSEENNTIDQEELENLQKTEIATDEQKKPMRASAKKALDEMQAIQSEQQRLHREAHISVPYHKPKRYTLQEFLKRRTIIKPAVENGGSPVAAIVQKKSLKMTPEELEEYAKLMDDRAKEATEFFKSETESDEEEELKDNMGAMCVEQKATEYLEKEEQKEAGTPVLDAIEPGTFSLDMPSSQPMEVDSLDLENTEMPAITLQISSQPLITEVLELPNLDLSTLHVNEMDDNVPACSMQVTTPASASIATNHDIGDLKKQLFAEDILTESPTIKGDANMIIDLESGDMIKKKPSGADNLLQRLLATHKARKSKTNETVNILSNENGRLEMTKVSIHINDDDGINKEQKPGAAYVKLKENLKTLIKKKRLEELHRKQEDENEYNKCLEGDDDDCEDEDEENLEEYELEDGGEKVIKKAIVIDDEENELGVFADTDEDLEEEEEAETDEKVLDEEDEKLGEIADKPLEAILGFDDNSTKSNNKSDNDTSDTDTDTDNENDELSKNAEFKFPLTATQRKNRIIKAFAADSDDDDGVDLLKTQIPAEQTNVANALFSNLDSPLKSTTISIPCGDDGDIGVQNTQELLSLCSGSFDVTQKATTTTADTVLISQIPMTQRSHLIDTSEELLGLCSGTFDGNSVVQQPTQVASAPSVLSETTQELPEEAVGETMGAANRILSSDEERVKADKETDTRKRVKKLRKKLRKRQVKLGFSDDEDEVNDVVPLESDLADDVDGEVDDDNDEVDMPETFVEYDSEENEIVVQMTKGDRIKRAENFFEKEAELSESDWGSADEDENHVDKYDIELGDEDEFDGRQLQQELGQIHARKMLDEDIRKVRQIQELLFEDEETDGVGRQRQFRWKHAENGFSLDDMRTGGAGEDGIDGESGDEEQKQEHLWRKIRFEREQLLKEQGLIEDSQEAAATNLGTNSPLATIIGSKNTTPVLGSNGKRFQIITKKKTSTMTMTKQKGSPFLISSSMSGAKTATTAVGMTPPTASILQPKAARGSFLARDKETLTKFANLTKSKGAAGFDEDETAGTVSVKGRNFVFATLTKEEHEHLKRKADDLLNSSTETGTNFMKRPRTNVDKQCLIDQLLM